MFRRTVLLSRRTALRPPKGLHRGTAEAERRFGVQLDLPDLRSQLAAIVEHSNDAIFSRTFDGVITTWNAAAARIFGYAEKEILGKSSRALLPLGREDEFRGLVARLRRGQVVEHFETERVRKDGRHIQISLTLSPIRDSSQRLVDFSTSARDMTEQRSVCDMLARRDREMNDLFEEASMGLVILSPDGVVLRAYHLN